jgi:hypothetical protein
MAIINVRSPKYVSIDDSSLSYAILKLYIWNGSSSSQPPTETYNIRKSGVQIVFFEIAELIRDYLDTTFDGNYNGQAVWVSTSLRAYDSDNDEVADDGESFIAFDGYDYFEESANVSNPIMITNRNLSVLKDNTFKIPIYTITSPTVRYYVNGQLVSTVTYLSSNQSDEQIEYISILNNDKITVTDSSGIKTINIEILEECKYEPKKVTFVNKYGALQDMIFFKKSVEKMNVKKESYKSNILSSNYTYSSSNHVYRDFNVVGKESVTLSSGFLSEEYNEVFKQMMLSEKVWVTNVINSVAQVLPINVKTSNITYKTSLNDKLVEYTFDFDNSFNVINDIR